MTQLLPFLKKTKKAVYLFNKSFNAFSTPFWVFFESVAHAYIFSV